MTSLPPDAGRYLVRMRSLTPPVELVDSIMAEVEATPQARPGPDLRTVATFTLAAAAALLAVALLLRITAPNVGPAPSPVPLDELPSAGAVQARISIEQGDVPEAFGHGFLWLTNAATGELIRMDPANGSIFSPMAVTQTGSAVPIALTESAVWLVDRRDASLVELDPDVMEERRRIPVAGTIAALAADGSDLWLLDVEAGQLVRINSADGSTTLSAAVEGATSLLVHAGAVWVGDQTGALTRIDPASGGEAGRVDVGMPVRRLIADGDSVIVLGEPGEPIVRVDPSSMVAAARGAGVLDAAAEGGRVWAVVGSGHLVRLDPETLQPVAADLVELDASGTVGTGGGSLWIPGLDEASDAYLLKIAPVP